VYPRLLVTPFFTIHTFGLLLAAAYLAALWWMTRGAREAGLDEEALVSLGLSAIIGAIVGAKALMVLRSLPEYAASPSALWSISLLTSAGDFYGGFIGALVASALFFRRHPRVPAWRAADVCAPAIALGQAIGRIGCFMAGDDYGRPAHVPWAVAFTDPDAASIGGAPLGVPLHPVQLYESAVCLALFFVLVRLARRRHRDGDIIAAYTLLYAVARFGLEFFRGDADRGFIFGGLLSTSQAIAIVMAGIATAVLATRGRRPADTEAGARTQPARAARTQRGSGSSRRK
jgi:phosphatidylglycerol:prolipoprotein diacylglycerol transferase